MIRRFRIALWYFVAELEYHLYPWKMSDKAPNETAIKYNLPEQSFDTNLYYDWIKGQDQKIQKIEEDIVFILNGINQLEQKYTLLNLNRGNIDNDSGI